MSVSFLSLSLAGLFYLLLHTVVTIHILLFKEDVKSAIGWIGLVWMAPIAGSIVYILFGINRIHRKALVLSTRRPIKKLIEKLNTKTLSSLSPSFLQFLKLGYHVHPQNFSLGNTVIPFENGDDAYPAMCQLICRAKHYVWLQSYIFNDDIAGQSFVSALEHAASKGVQIKVLVDGVGLNYSSPNILSALKKIAQVETSVFLPSKHLINLPFVNLRNHRKILIVDGTHAFFGGMNIAAGNLLKTEPKEPIQDVTFQVSGPVVEQISCVFEEDWAFSTQTTFTRTAVRHTQNGSVAARIIPDGPDSNYGKLPLLFIGALNSAQQKVQIVTPYFLPEEDILSALEVAAMRGIRVEIILPQKNNIWGMDRAMRANFVRLLTRGVKIYRTAPPFDHSKLFLIDDEWVCIGSANWDVRSLKLNFECVMECLNEDLAARVATIIEHKKQKARQEILSVLQQRPWYQKLLDNAFKLLTPYY